MKPQELLRQYWGHSSFRQGQEEVMEAVLNEKDTLAVLPTGGGKSICYQIPGLLRDGIAIVISPLVALMQDQVEQLRERGIKAVALSGGLAFEAVDRLLDNCIYGDYKFLFLSPERLQQDLVQGRIKQMKISLIVVDEAHCISHWGHDFRPSYTKLAILRELAADVPVLALTATANEQVIDDIRVQLHFKDSFIYKGSVVRSNLSYQSITTEDKYKALKQILRKNAGTGIVYLRSRRGCEHLTEWLSAQGFEALSYHGGLDTVLRKKRLNLWKESNSLIMVATNAFGMGIDKADVRIVAHFQLPESLESYYQEAGRAGRDGKTAVAVILTNKDDLDLARQRYIEQQPDLNYVKKVYKLLQQYLRIAYGEGAFSAHNFDYGAFCQDYQLSSAKTYSSFQLLDRLGILRLNPVFSQQTKVQFTAGNEQLLDFFDKNPKPGLIGQMLLRMYGGAAEVAVKIALKPLARQLNRPESFIIDQLKFMAGQGILELELHEADSEVNFLVPREDDRTINPLAKFITKFHKQKVQQFKALTAFVKNTKDCRQALLAGYFDESVLERCGSCDNCLAVNSKTQSDRPDEKLIKQLLKDGPLSRDELAEKLNFDRKIVGEVLQELLNQELISIDATNRFKLK